MGTYITSADISNVHLKSFPVEILEPYIAEANVWIEDLGMSMGVNPTEMTSATDLRVKRYLSNYVNYRFAEDSIGVNDVEVQDDDIYLRMYNTYYKIAENLKPQITPEILTGTADNNPISYSISTGTLWRTA